MNNPHIKIVAGRVRVSPEYRAWQNMKFRCLNPNSPQYVDYGGRGITIDARWVDSFANFYADMGARPKEYSLERRNNDLPYSKDNCYWATSRQQAANRRKAVPSRNPRPRRSNVINPKLGQPVKNKFGVPKRQWDKWHNLARRVFNNVYTSMRPSMQWSFLHPDAALMSKAHWQTTRWNAAWTAARAANGGGYMKGVEMNGSTYTKAPKKAKRRG